MIDVAIVGATGLVGQKIIECMESEGLFEKCNLFLFASEKTCGKSMMVHGKRQKIYSVEEGLCRKFDIAFFSAGDEVSLKWVKKFAANGAFVIDNSNAFRRVEGVPLVVPEINISSINSNTKIIANPNCSTIQLVVVLERLMRLCKIEEVVVSTYQSVSGAGKEALADLENGTNNVFKEGILNNVLPQIGQLTQSGFCVEEDKIMFETNKILGSKINIASAAVRVPISHCHGESVFVRFEKEVDIFEVKRALQAPYLVFDENQLSLATEVAGTDETHICRLRKTFDRAVMMFIVADNLRRGAAYNAVLIAKHIAKNFL